MDDLTKLTLSDVELCIKSVRSSISEESVRLSRENLGDREWNKLYEMEDTLVKLQFQRAILRGDNKL